MSSGRVRGGFNQYGFTVGILILDTRFPRIPGDVGNAATFPFPVRYHRVSGADPDLVVRRGAEGLLPAFVQGARALEGEGVGAITTSCGFLAKYQQELAAAVRVPVFTSSLLMVPLVHRLLPAGRRVGIMTVNAAALGPGPRDELPIGRREVELAEPVGRDPRHGLRLPRLDRPRLEPAPEEVQDHGSVRILPPDRGELLADREARRELFRQLPLEAGLGRLANLLLAARELPEPIAVRSTPALCDQVSMRPVPD